MKTAKRAPNLLNDQIFKNCISQSSLTSQLIQMATKEEVPSVVDATTALKEVQIEVEPHMIHSKDGKWEVRADALQGRYLVAKVDVKAGDLVLKELPYAFVPFEGPEGQVRLSQILAHQVPRFVTFHLILPTQFLFTNILCLLLCFLIPDLLCLRRSERLVGGVQRL